MFMPVSCSNCNTYLQLPTGSQIVCCSRCALRFANSRCPPPPPPLPRSYSFSSSSYNNRRPSLSYAFSFFSYNNRPPPPSRLPCQRKRAVICGINYKGMGKNMELEGCINDAIAMQNLLVREFKFPASSIRMLTEKGGHQPPTKINITIALRWLVQDCQAGDSLVFYFAGHGDQQPDNTGDEVDELDETLLPLDYETKGVIVDDEINEMIVRPIPGGVKLHAIVDACHSGTVLDLPFLCKIDKSGQRWFWKDHRRPQKAGVWKGTKGGEVISFSGCNDHQCAVEKTIPRGAMTWAFIDAIDRGCGNTYGNLLIAMQSTVLKDCIDTDSVIQEPQLTSSEVFDVFTRPFSL
ncbi:metacaspase-1-like [Rosa rugosa]|uniref:metacaspase-1-like n=1 Tax=Rosa rugosa TaxID=74645 RepID=UPI002B406691|nr:metacaspase-1-like [Rosa rugosa]